MKKYESVIVLNDLLNEGEVKTEILKVESFINKESGNIIKTDNLGKKQLPYEIEGHKEGIYVIFYFKGNENLTNELLGYYRNADNILEFLTIRTNS